METQSPKGTKDSFGQQEILRQEIINTLIRNFELFGFNPLRTPTMEYLEVLSSKYAGGSQILKEVFKLKDQGERDLGLRYDLTVPLARFIASNPNIKLPYKRYQIGQVYRDGPIKSARYREFTQSDVDIVGSKSLLADAEIIYLASKIFRELDLDVVIKVNSRKLLFELMKLNNIPKQIQEEVLLSLDKLEKIKRKKVEEELLQKGLEQNQIDSLLKTVTTKKDDQEILIDLKQKLEDQTPILELEELFNYTNMFGVKNIKLDLTLARGLNYYTGAIFEVYLTNSKITSSVAAGGRYDNIIGEFLSSNQGFPAVGISFGLDVISDALSATRQNQKTKTQVYIIPIGPIGKALELASLLRENAINTDIDLQGRGISKNLDYANKYGIPYVIFVGQKEIEQKKYKLRDLNTGKEELLTGDQIIERLS